MFAYCGNNPINRIDPEGLFWSKIESFFSNAWNKVKTWASNTFGASISTTSTAKEENAIVPDPSPITVETGTKTTQTISTQGDSSKPISVYAVEDYENPVISSSAGININIGNFTLNVSVGLDNLGISGSITGEDSTTTFGLKTNLSEFKIGLEGAVSVPVENKMKTTYTNVSANGWGLATIFVWISTGSFVPSPASAH